MCKIGSLTLKSNLILAPLAGVSDLPFRMISREFGCELAFVEMINVRSLGYGSRKTKQMLSTYAQDKPLGVQLLGREPGYLHRALDILQGYTFDVLDFNAACPEKKVIRRGEGAALLKDPARLCALLKIIVSSVRVPVTVKIRAGWDKNSINAREVALAAQDTGISALSIHGRTRSQGYGEKVDYKIIAEVKKALRIPVIASGDMLSPELTRKMFEETGCDAVLVARGAMGNPWIFRQILEFLKDGRRLPAPQGQEIADVMQRHLQACVDFHGERTGVSVFHKFFGWYTKGLRKVRRLREAAYRAKTKTDMLSAIEACKPLGRSR
ncbi:MAG TPA: tRNA dihydrouridine synthase DusB [Patescibacteria group bacterium]|nr:tRNA dihydrouridine synthase DusB [Patescibacteria group bacterium]